MKKYLKKYWYLVLLLLFIPLYFVFDNKEEQEVVETLVKEELNVEKEDIKEEVIKKKYAEIKGEVKRPGVYEITDDSRVIDIIEMSGGLTKNADTSIINLSKSVTDEMSIKIYSKDEIKAARESIEPKTIEVIKEVEKIVEKECKCEENVCVTNDEVLVNEEIITDNNDILVDNELPNEEEKKEENKLININTATKEELMTIIGIGESKAIKIIEYRKDNVFNTIEDIMNVPGIGNAMFEKIKEYITV